MKDTESCNGCPPIDNDYSGRLEQRYCRMRRCGVFGTTGSYRRVSYAVNIKIADRGGLYI